MKVEQEMDESEWKWCMKLNKKLDESCVQDFS